MRVTAIKFITITIRNCLLLVAFILASCAQQPLPQVDLQNSNWQVLRGQASWQPAGDRPRIAGDVLIATDNAGNSYIEFSKTPVAIFTAQIHNSRWALNMIASSATHHGRGTPPKRFIWFYVPDFVMKHTPLPDSNWSFEYKSGDTVILKNPKTGENIRLVMDSPLP